MRTLSILCCILLLAAVARLPIGYYTFLRIAVTFGALAVIISEMTKSIGLWIIVFALIAIVFNPVIPVYLYKKSLWTPIDILAAVAFGIYSLTFKRRKNV